MPTFSGTEVAAVEAVPPTKQAVELDGGRLRVKRFSFVAPSGGLAANDLIRLCRMPAGRILILSHLSAITFDTWGASRTLDIGHEGFTQPDGTVVSAVVDQFADGLDANQAASILFSPIGTGADPVAGATTQYVNARNPWYLTGKLLGGTLAAAKTCTGLLVYVND